MRWNARRIFVGAAVLLVGIVGLDQSSMEAAPVAEAEFQSIVDQNAKSIVAWADTGKKAVDSKSKGKITTASRSVRSNAMLIALLAQGQMGKNAAEDGKLAALRDAAIAAAKAAGNKKFGDALTVGKTLSLTMPAGKGPAKIISSADLVKDTDFDIDDVMHPFRKTEIGGMNYELDIKANAKKATMTPDKIAAMAARIHAIADYSEIIPPTKGFAAKNPKKDWDLYLKDMRTATDALVTASKGKDTKGLQGAFLKLDGACNTCHEKFK